MKPISQPCFFIIPWLIGGQNEEIFFVVNSSMKVAYKMRIELMILMHGDWNVVFFYYFFYLKIPHLCHLFDLGIWKIWHFDTFFCVWKDYIHLNGYTAPFWCNLTIWNCNWIWYHYFRFQISEGKIWIGSKENQAKK